MYRELESGPCWPGPSVSPPACTVHPSAQPCREARPPRPDLDPRALLRLLGGEPHRRVGPELACPEHARMRTGSRGVGAAGSWVRSQSATRASPLCPLLSILQFGAAADVREGGGRMRAHGGRGPMRPAGAPPPAFTHWHHFHTNEGQLGGSQSKDGPRRRVE